MAVAFESVAYTEPASGTSSVVTKPTGLSVGDLMIGHCALNSTGSSSLSLPAGWTAGDEYSSGNFRAKWGYKIADASDVSASNFTFTGSGTDRIMGGAIYRFSGVAPATIIDDFAKNNFTGTGSVNVDASVTPTRAGDILLALFAGASISSDGSMTGTVAVATSNPTWTEDYDMNRGSGSLPMAGAHSTPRTEITATGNVSTTFDEAVNVGSVFVIAVANSYSTSVSADVVSTQSVVPSPTITGGATLTADVVSAQIVLPDPTASQDTWSFTQKPSAPSWTFTSK